MLLGAGKLPSVECATKRGNNFPMTDAAFAIAPMIPSPRQPSLTSSDQLGEAAGDGSAFNLAMQDDADAQNDAPSKPAAPNHLDGNNSAPRVAMRSNSNAANGNTNGVDTESDSTPAADAGDAKPHKAEKSQKTADGKAGSNADKTQTAQNNAAPLLAAILVAPTAPIVEPEKKTDVLADGTVKLDAPNKADGKADSVKPDKSSVLASSAPAADNTPIVGDSSAVKPSADASAVDAAKQVVHAQASQAEIMVQGGTDNASANRPVLKAESADGKQGKTAPPSTSNSKAVAKTNAAVDTPAASQNVPTSSKTSDAAKQHRSNGASTNISKDATAPTNANVTIGAAPPVGRVLDSKSAGKGSSNQTGDGNATPVQNAIGVAATEATKASAQNGLALDRADAATAKPDESGKTAFAVNQQDKADSQQTNNAPSVQGGHPTDAGAAIKAAAQVMPAQPAPQTTPPQPAVPSLSDFQAQNSAFVAHIIHTSDGSIPTPTIQAQMDGPRLTLPADQIALQIHRHQMAGIDHFDIRIDPPDLGRIDVKLEMSSDGQTKAHVSADRQDTLNLLQRDSSHLERALNSNGLKTSLNFSLRQDSGAWNRGNGNWNGASPVGSWSGDDEIAESAAPVHARVIDPTRIDILI